MDGMYRYLVGRSGPISCDRPSCPGWRRLHMFAGAGTWRETGPIAYSLPDLPAAISRGDRTERLRLISQTEKVLAIDKKGRSVLS